MACEQGRPIQPATAPPQTQITPAEVRPQPLAVLPPAGPPDPLKPTTCLEPTVAVKPPPNFWLNSLPDQQPIRYDWFVRLVYCKLAEKFGNSREGRFGPNPCWSIALSQTKDIADPAFHGIFLTEKGGLGFLNHGQMARFYNGVAFLGTEESALEGIGVSLAAVGLDSQERIVFITLDDYAAKFGVPERTVAQEVERLR